MIVWYSIWVSKIPSSWVTWIRNFLRELAADEELILELAKNRSLENTIVKEQSESKG